MIEIRKACLKDVPAIVSLWEEFMLVHDKIVFKRNKKLRQFLKRNKYASVKFKNYAKKQIKSKNGIIFIAEINGAIAGYNLSKIENEIPIYEEKKIGYICDLFVKKGFKGKKVSTKLKDSAIKWFKKKGIKNIAIKLHSDNIFAYSIYKKWGFIDYTSEVRKRL